MDWFLLSSPERKWIIGISCRVFRKEPVASQRTDAGGGRPSPRPAIDPSECTMNVSAAVKILISLLLILHFSGAQKPRDESVHTAIIAAFGASPQSLISLLLLGLTVVLSASIYLWVLRYVCIGCCQPIAVGAEPEDLAGIV